MKPKVFLVQPPKPVDEMTETELLDWCQALTDTMSPDA
jgi:hypothetical protein